MKCHHVNTNNYAIYIQKLFNHGTCRVESDINSERESIGQYKNLCVIHPIRMLI